VPAARTSHAYQPMGAMNEKHGKDIGCTRSNLFTRGAFLSRAGHALLAGLAVDASALADIIVPGHDNYFLADGVA